VSDRPTVLFVDDEERVVNLLRSMFRGEYDVLVATSGVAALEIVRRHLVHVIVSDQRMPGLTGIDVLNQVRELSPATMRILLTGHSDLSAIVGSVNDGEVYRFINKPWNNDELKGVIGEAARIACETQAATVAATQEAPGAVPKAAAADEAPALLVLDDNARVPQWFRDHFGAAYPVIGASSVAAALDALERHDVGVIVTGESVGGESTLRLLRALKQQYPMIMAVMLTATQDSDLVVRLISEVKVCRVLFKPVKTGAVDLALKAAMKQHAVNRGDPTLWRRERVVERGSEPDDAGLRQSLLDRVRARLAWLARRAGATT
jgi:DNA-binding NtrC family response regulator